MILMVSGRCDIVAFYTDWFMNRLKAGFVDVRNPFNPKLVSRINFENVDAIMFCTKNPIPIVDRLKEINKPILFHITITGYNDDIEPNVPDKKDIIEAVKKISNIIGKEFVTVRYDPIFINDKYTLEYHIKAFNKLCTLLDGYASRILISFIDEYKNVKKNYKYLNYRELNDNDYEIIGKEFSKIAKSHNMNVFTCFEERNLTEYGFVKDDCLSAKIAYELTGKLFNGKWMARKEKRCNCIPMVDIGSYNSCNHLCKYCYANYDEDKIINNMNMHNPNSSLLIGELNSDDIIKERYK